VTEASDELQSLEREIARRNKEIQKLNLELEEWSEECERRMRETKKWSEEASKWSMRKFWVKVSLLAATVCYLPLPLMVFFPLFPIMVLAFYYFCL